MCIIYGELYPILMSTKIKVAKILSWKKVNCVFSMPYP